MEIIKRSQCKCDCHKPEFYGMVHVINCCEPDDVTNVSYDPEFRKEVKAMLREELREYFLMNHKPKILFKKEINKPLKTKNKWLYPADQFGKMETGVVFDSETSKNSPIKSIVEHFEFKIHDVSEPLKTGYDNTGPISNSDKS